MIDAIERFAGIQKSNKNCYSTVCFIIRSRLILATDKSRGGHSIWYLGAHPRTKK